MSTPSSALVGYAVLRANYNSAAPNYLDNFAPFVLSAISSDPNAVVERHAIANSIRDVFGIDIPALVVPRLLRRTTRAGLTEPVGTEAVRLTPKGEEELPDLSAELAAYRDRQVELIHELSNFIVTEFPEHEELTTGDIGASLAEFFDRQAVPVVRKSLGRSSDPEEGASGIQFVVAAFVAHLAARDQTRFGYVVEAAKGAMLASVLDLDTSGMRESLNNLTLVLDTPIAMDALGHHGAIPQSAMTHFLDMAKVQGARVVIFAHSVSEVDGILESVEVQLRRGPNSRSVSSGYLHFAEIGASPADIAVIRQRLPERLADLGIEVIERPDGYQQYGLDEIKLEERIQARVRYSQDAARINDVRSLSAVHRLRKGNRAQVLERCRAVLVTSNSSLVRGAADFRDEGSFPLAATSESVASLLWVRGPALAPDVPREMVLATAFVGMQPSPTLWGKYLAEVEALEETGVVTADDAIVLRSTRVGREALMAESLGDVGAVGEALPVAVLDRVKEAISNPLQSEVGDLAARLAQSESVANNATADWLRQVAAREEAETKAAERKAEAENLRARLDKAEQDDAKKREHIASGSRQTARRWVRSITWSIRLLALLVAVGAIWLLVSSRAPEAGLPVIVVGTLGALSFLAPFLPPLDLMVRRVEDRLTDRIRNRRLVGAGYGSQPYSDPETPEL